MEKSEEREGPKIAVTYSCYGCKHEASESYACQSDSGQDVFCAHPSFSERKRIGDTAWNTPAFCPYLPEEIKK